MLIRSFVVACSLFFVACTNHSVAPKKVDGLSDISQNPSLYTQGINKGKISSLKEYKRYFFAPWHIEKITLSKKQMLWPLYSYKPSASYGENFQKLSQDFFSALEENANYEMLGEVSQKGYTLHRVNLRALPTQRALFKNPHKAGEGFPFDYLQNSSIGARKPLFISHYSKDKAWVFVKSSFAYGWVLAREVAFVDETTARNYEEGEQLFFLEDKHPIYNKKGEFLFYTQVGMMVPKSLDMVYDPQWVHKGVVAFNTQNITHIVRELQKSRYGWGGMYGERDCSSTMRDFFAPFGIWLPRNSSAQARVGKVLSLVGLSDEEKLDTIKKEAVAFETLLYQRGHILLYVGTVDNKVIVFQNRWGIKTKEDGKMKRTILGRAIFSTLNMGKNLQGYDKNYSTLRNLRSMNRVTAQTSVDQR